MCENEWRLNVVPRSVDMDLPTYLGRYYVGHTIFLYRARSIGAITLPLLFADASSFIKTLISTYLD